MTRHPFYAEFQDDLQGFIAAIPPRERYAIKAHENDAALDDCIRKDYTGNIFFLTPDQQRMVGSMVFFQPHHIAPWTRIDQPDPMAAVPSARWLPFCLALFWLCAMEQNARSFHAFHKKWMPRTKLPVYAHLEDDRSSFTYASPHRILVDLGSRLPPYLKNGRHFTPPEIDAAVVESTEVVPEWCRKYVANHFPEIDADQFFYGLHDVVARWIPPHLRKTP